jgi:lysyl-tRNA synthetase class 2
MRRIRHYFDAQRVLEVDTPALSPYAVSDTQIESFEIPNSRISRRSLFLHTSPEFCMKRLLCAGYPDIFSVCRVFRDGESGRRHQPEFTMIEWYRLGFGLRAIIDDTLALIHAALSAAVEIEKVIEHDYRDVFEQVTNIDPLTATINELQDAAHADSDLRQAVGDAREDWLDLILASRIAPSFENDRLTVLRHFPASQAALARLCPHDPRVADRFEVFYGRLELANGYVELQDAGEQLRRMQQDNRDRVRRNRRVGPHDKPMLAALDAGLPDCAGVALGLERLHMLHDNTDDMRDVISFSFEAYE